MSLKDLEHYIYSSVVLPLSDLDLPSLGVSSPLVNKRGEALEFFITTERVTGDFHYNYQRDKARLMANRLVMVGRLYQGGEHVVAEYDERKRSVIVYPEAIQMAGLPRIVTNKLINSLMTHEPFCSVREASGIRLHYREVDVEDLR